MDDDPEAVQIIQEYINSGWLKEFDTLQHFSNYVNGTPVLNKFACWKQNKWDDVSKTQTVKRRIILDSKRSRVKEACDKEFRSILPRVTDAINSIMALLHSAAPHQEVEQLVLDAKHAFWQNILRQCERKYFCG